MNGITTAYSYDETDRLTQEGAASYSYDANGNTLQKTEGGQTTSYSYDAQNRLVEVTKPSGTLQYGYDADGIRTSKTEGGVTTNYVVDHNRQYAQVLAELENGSLAKTFTYGDDLVSQQAVGGQESFYLYDGLGTTRGLTDGSGVLSDEYFYEAFGELLASTGSTENSYLYTGEQYDADLEQYYLRARYYDPAVGRFTQMDTWQGRLQEPVTLHKYLYAHADPVRHIDPSGRMTAQESMMAYAVLATLTAAAISTTHSGLLDGTGSASGGYDEVEIGLLTIMALDPRFGAKILGLLGSKVDTDANTRNDKPVDLYRAVETTEYTDIFACRCFRTPDLGYGVEPTAIKRFFFDASSAVKFGDLQLKGISKLDQYFVVQATVSRSMIATLDQEPGDRHIGPGVGVPVNMLPAFNAEVQRFGGIKLIGSY